MNTENFMFIARPALTGSSLGVSFQSVFSPTEYISVVTSTGLFEGSLRLGITSPGAALDNATWLVVPGRAGGVNTYSFQVRLRDESE